VVLIFLETAFMTIVGLVLGNALAALANYTLMTHPITLGGVVANIYAEYGFLPQVLSSVKCHLFRNASISIFVIAMISCIYPAYRVAQLEPMQGMRHV
jgi:ABC-type lipoprotein release transport system permease subunit